MYLYQNEKVKLVGEGRSSDHEGIRDQVRAINAAEMFFLVSEIYKWRKEMKKAVDGKQFRCMDD